MHGLGKIQSSSRVFSVNKLALKKTVADKRGGIRGIQQKNAPATLMSAEAVDISASLKERHDQELKSAENPAGAVNARLDALRKSFPEWIREIFGAIAEGEQEEALIASGSVKFLQAQANIVPGVALHLLTSAG